MTIHCPHCRREMLEKVPFCGACGCPLGDPVADPVAGGPSPPEGDGSPTGAVTTVRPAVVEPGAVASVDAESVRRRRARIAAASAAALVVLAVVGLLTRGSAPRATPGPTGSPPEAAGEAPASPAVPVVVSPVSPVSPVASAPGRKTRKGPASSPSTAVPSSRTAAAAPSPAKVREAVESDSVRFVVESHAAQVRACYERVFKDAAPAARVEIAFTVDAQGRAQTIHTVRDSLGNAQLSRCLEARLAQWQFARPAGAPLEVVYPFVFAGAAR